MKEVSAYITFFFKYSDVISDAIGYADEPKTWIRTAARTMNISKLHLRALDDAGGGLKDDYAMFRTWRCSCLLF